MSEGCGTRQLGGAGLCAGISESATTREDGWQWDIDLQLTHIQRAHTIPCFDAQDIILAPGSVPFVPPGCTVDEKTVYTSDGALELQSVPEWVAIVGSGYIGLEFSDVYTALGSEVTFIEALPNIMPTFDKEIAKLAERLLIRERPIDYRTGVFASEITPGIPGEKPVTIKMIDAETK